METFVVYADWSTAEPVTDEDLAVVNAAWPADDPTFCSSVDGGLVRLSFDVVGRNFDEAAAKARNAMTGLRQQTDLLGTLTQFVMCNEEGQLDLPTE